MNKDNGNNLLAAERHAMILKLVNEQGSARVTELSELCEVSEETVRRDLDRLEKQNKLRRSHGGAVRLNEQNAEIPYLVREEISVQEKKKIAKAALKYIQHGDRIILDASSTTYHMASILPDIPLTVITNSIRIAVELSTRTNIQVIATGGMLVSSSLSFVGPLAERALDMYHVDKAFISCKGVHLQWGTSESNDQAAMIKRKMMGMANASYLLVDYTKFGVRSFAQIAALSDFDVMITNQELNIEYRHELAQMPIELIQIS